MFLKSFIELLTLYKNIYIDTCNKLANRSYFARYSVEYNIYKVSDDITLFNIYSEFVKYYDNWYVSFYMK